MKKKLSFILAAAMTLSMAASAVYATDYSSPPSYTRPPITRPPVSVPSGGGSGSSGGHSSLAVPDYVPTPAKRPNGNEKLPDAGTSLSNPVSVIDKDSMSDAVINDTPIYASYESAVIKSNALALLARTNLGKLTVITRRYTAVIESSSVTEAKDIDLGLKLTKSTSAGALVLRTNQSGSYGCTVNFSISSEYYSQAGVNLNKAHTYYVDSNKKVYDLGRVLLDGSGNILLPLTSGGKYIVM